LIVLVLRRIWISTTERTEGRIETRIRPTVLGFLDGDIPGIRDLTRRDRGVFDRLLIRYSNQISGSKLDSVSQYFSSTHEIDREIATLLSARRAWKRYLAAQRLGAINATVAGPALIVALRDKNFEVRRATVRSLGRLAVADATAGLISALAEGRTPDSLTLWALLQMGAPALETARAHLANGDDRMKIYAIRLVELLGSPRDSVAISTLVHDLSPGVRSAAALALGRLGGASSLTLLLELLEDEEGSVRRDACKALGRLRDKTAIASLLLHADTDEFDVAMASSEALFATDPSILVDLDPGAISSALMESRDLAFIERS